MKNGFRIIDSEPHLEEPFDLWERCLEEPYRSLTRITRPEGAIDRHASYYLGPNVVTRPPTDSRRSIPELGDRRLPKQPLLREARMGGPPRAFLEAFDIEGIDIGVFMPSDTQALTRHDGIDPHHALALCQVYNDWAHEFTQSNPDRLKFWAWLPAQDANLAAREARRCVTELDALGVSMSNGAIDGHLLSDEFFEPLWREMNSLGVPFGLHGPATGWIKDDLRARFRGHRRTDVVQSLHIPIYGFFELGELITGGVLERYPNLKPVVMESGASWLTWLLPKLDERWELFGADQDYTLSMMPSDYFRRQCHVVADPGEPGLRYVIDFLGDDNLLFSTDFPHPDCAFPESTSTFLALEGISETSKRKMLWDNPVRLFGLETRAGELVASAR